MKRFIFLLSLQLSALSLWALSIPKGSLYFDNSKTAYHQISFVYGSDQRQETYVVAMTQDGNKWRVDIPQTVNDMYRFTFVGGALEEGLHNQDFNTYKEYVSKTLNLNRTATRDDQMQSGDIFVPESGDNWTQGTWMSLSDWQAQQSQSGTATISGTLPVVYLTTNDNQAITDKENYKAGTVRIDPLSTGYAALGTEEAPISAQLKGRGNYTWTGFDKKPYKIKFDVKQNVLGMPSNKHWCLMAHADDNLGFLRNTIGFKLSELIGLKWTPRFVPVELVINGKYEGLYFLTEHVRVSGKRVNITEQDDLATDSVTGGWLVEIDNYWEEGNIEFWEGNGQKVMVTPKSPEILSGAQRDYVTGQLNTLNSAIYGASSAALWGMLDLDEAAKYYLVQEIMEDCESYHGSCYLYKDRDRNGQTCKWFFGPVWDFGNAYNRHQENWIYVNPIFEQYWIGQIASWSEFQTKTQEYWYVFYHSYVNTVRDEIASFASLIAQAAANDAARWKNSKGYQDNSNMVNKKKEFLNNFNWRVNWLYSKWGQGKEPTWNNTVVTNEQDLPTKYIHNGQIYIRRNNQLFDITGQRIQ
jgi:hypothetical protein